MTSSRGFRRPAVVLSMACVLTASGRAAPGPINAPVPPIVQRCLERQEEPLTRYRALRRLQADNIRYKKQGWLEAWTTLEPERGFKYQIVAEGGSSYIRDKVLRKALEREAQAYARSEAGAAAIAPANYVFTEDGRSPDGLSRIAIEPVRKESMLVRGWIYLTPDDADLARIEGQLAKSPSFWTRRVDIVRRYQRIGGVRVPIAIDSVAQVLVAGRSTFTMVCEYADINGREVGQPQPRVTEVEAARPKR